MIKLNNSKMPTTAQSSTHVGDGDHFTTQFVLTDVAAFRTDTAVKHCELCTEHVGPGTTWQTHDVAHPVMNNYVRLGPQAEMQLNDPWQTKVKGQITYCQTLFTEQFNFCMINSLRNSSTFHPYSNVEITSLQWGNYNNDKAANELAHSTTTGVETIF